MLDVWKKTKIANKPGFITALDQSGGSTPAALNHYGLSESEYSDESEMYYQMHAMRVRIMTAPSFSGEKIIGTILFEKTMDGEVEGTSVPAYLWKNRNIVSFLKVDKGLEALGNGVQLMKPITDLEGLLARAANKGIFGTKMRSLIREADRSGIASAVKQQFEIGMQVLNHGLIPIIEPEVSIRSTTKELAENILRTELTRELDRLPQGVQVILKLTLPTVPGTYDSLVNHDAVLRVVALSGGYSRVDACRKLALNPGVVASFSRALTENLKVSMTDDQFDASLSCAIDQIYSASVNKIPTGDDAMDNHASLAPTS